MRPLITIVLCCVAAAFSSSSTEAITHNEYTTSTRVVTAFVLQDYEGSNSHQQDAPGDSRHWYTTFEKPGWLVLVGMLTLIAIGFQANEMRKATNAMRESTAEVKRQADLTEKQIVLTQRPKIVVRHFYFRDPNNARYAPFTNEGDSSIEGEYFLVNIGGTAARIFQIRDETLIGKSLPMREPHESRTGPLGALLLQPGESMPIPFSAKGIGEMRQDSFGGVPDIDVRFFVVGQIGYKDDLGIYRITRFGRVFDRGKQRFIPVDDPDYEYCE